MPVCHRRRLKMIHIPKTGGTAVVRALGMEHTGHHCGWWDYPAETKDYLTFAIVRDPLARFVSQYNYAMSTETCWHKQGSEFEYPDLAELQQMSLVELIKDLALNHEQRRLRECGWWLQSQFIFEHNGKRHVDFLIGYEQLQTQLNQMLVRHGMEPVDIPKHNVSQRTITCGTLVNNQEFYERFLEVYSQDYANLEYSPVAFR